MLNWEWEWEIVGYRLLSATNAIARQQQGEEEEEGTANRLQISHFITNRKSAQDARHNLLPRGGGGRG